MNKLDRFVFNDKKKKFYNEIKYLTGRDNTMVSAMKCIYSYFWTIIILSTNSE